MEDVALRIRERKGSTRMRQGEHRGRDEEQREEMKVELNKSDRECRNAGPTC